MGLVFSHNLYHIATFNLHTSLTIGLNVHAIDENVIRIQKPREPLKYLRKGYPISEML